MSYKFPVDVQDLVSRVNQRGADVARFIGLKDGMRDDVALTHITWGIAHGWFPVHHDGSWHGAIDIGLPDWDGRTYADTPVYAIGDGEVLFVEPHLMSLEGYEFGRLIIKHRAPSGEVFYALYKHLSDLTLPTGKRIAAGDTVGKIGWYGSFPHLSFAVASLDPVGGECDLVPECARGSLPADDGVFNVLRVKMDAFDPVEWPIQPLQKVAGYLYNPIEFVRYCLGDPYEHDIGPGSLHEVEACTESFSRNIAKGVNNEVKVNPLSSKELKDTKSLVKMALDPGSPAIAKGASDQDAVKAIQRALKTCHYNVGRFGPAHDGIDGDFGNTTERIIKDFQASKLPDIFAGDDAKKLLKKFGQDASAASKDGSIDWLTLIALDISAAAHASAPPAPTPPVKEVPPANPGPTPCAGWTVEETVLNKAAATGVYQKWQNKWKKGYERASAATKSKKKGSMTKEQLADAKNWVAAFEAHEKWKVTQDGAEPEDPGATPQEVKDLAGGIPAGKKYEKPTQYDVTAPDGSKFSYEDHVQSLNTELDDGVGSKGKKGGKDLINAVFDAAGIQMPDSVAVKKAFTRVSGKEGGFDAVNTYDWGYVSVGFIQFTTGTDTTGSLAAVLRDLKEKAPEDFETYFKSVGIDVKGRGLAVVDESGVVHRGNAANTKIREDKRLTAAFQYAGAKSAEFRYAQVRTAYKLYYVPDMPFKIELQVPDPDRPGHTKALTLKGKYSDVLKSEAGKVASVDRGVQHGTGTGTSPDSAGNKFTEACQKVVTSNNLTDPSVSDLASHEPEIVLMMKNRYKVLEDSELTQPGATPPAKT